MPSATIDREQRDGFYEILCNHLAGLGDVWIALEARGDSATARRLSEEFVQNVRLLEDIGWDRLRHRARPCPLGVIAALCQRRSSGAGTRVLGALTAAGSHQAIYMLDFDG